MTELFSSSKVRFLIGIVCVSLCGCAAERLENNTLATSASATDMYYEMVLKNLARAYAQPNVLPWGMQLTSGNIAVNDNGQVTAGYSEMWPAVIPSVAPQYQRILQQGWATAPVSNMSAFLAMKNYYGAVITYAKFGGQKRYISVSDASPVDLEGNPLKSSQYTPVNDQPPVTSTTTTVNYLSNMVAGPVPPAAPPPAPPQSPPGPIGYQITTNAATYTSPNVALKSIDLSCFKFCKGPPPPGTISATFEDTTVYVYKDVADIHNLALFTMLIVGTIDQIPSKAPQSGPTSLGPNPPPLLTE